MQQARVSPANARTRAGRHRRRFPGKIRPRSALPSLASACEMDHKPCCKALPCSRPSRPNQIPRRSHPCPSRLRAASRERRSLGRAGRPEQRRRATRHGPTSPSQNSGPFTGCRPRRFTGSRPRSSSRSRCVSLTGRATRISDMGRVRPIAAIGQSRSTGRGRREWPYDPDMITTITVPQVVSSTFASGYAGV